MGMSSANSVSSEIPLHAAYKRVSAIIELATAFSAVLEEGAVREVTCPLAQ